MHHITVGKTCQLEKKKGIIASLLIGTHSCVKNDFSTVSNRSYLYSVKKKKEKDFVPMS